MRDPALRLLLVRTRGAVRQRLNDTAHLSP
jgi:hypothetical protein